MHVAVLTFPGHFFQSVLCIQSIIKHYRPSRLCLLLDDYACDAWLDYVHDFKTFVDGLFPDQYITYHVYSRLPLDGCVSGWWRAQLVKLLSDQFIDSNSWLLVDGDVIFERVQNLSKVTPYTRFVPGQDQPVAVMHQNYVSTCLGTDKSRLIVDGEHVATSPVPFRMVDRVFLQKLRQHVEAQHHKDFLELHLEWFRNQDIVAYEDPPTRMIMSEWELMECYQHYILNEPRTVLDVGSGYDTLADTKDMCGPVIYRHAYLRDAQIDPNWFKQQEIPISDNLWQKSLCWFHHHKS